MREPQPFVFSNFLVLFIRWVQLLVGTENPEDEDDEDNDSAEEIDRNVWSKSNQATRPPKPPMVSTKRGVAGQNDSDPAAAAPKRRKRQQVQVTLFASTSLLCMVICSICDFFPWGGGINIPNYFLSTYVLHHQLELWIHYHPCCFILWMCHLQNHRKWGIKPSQDWLVILIFTCFTEID